MRAKLTDKICRQKAPESRYIDISDEGTPLTLRIKTNGERIFLWRGRINGRQTKRVIGMYGDISLSDARSEAFAMRKDAKSEKPKLAPVIHPHHRPKEPTIETALVRYEREKLIDLATGPEIKAKIETHIVPEFGERTLKSLTRIELNQYFNRLRDDGYNGPALNRLIGAFKAFLNWCVKEDMIEFNPALTIDKKVKERPRKRILQGWELGAIQRALPELGQYGDPLGLLLHTAVRRSMIFGLRWGEVIEREDGSIELHFEDTKNGESHIAPVSKVAAQYLPKRHHDAKPTDRVYPDVCMAPGKLYGKMRKAVDKIAGQPVENWRLHDFRTACVTYISDQVGRGEHHFSERAIKLILTHKLNDVTNRHYNLSDSMAERIEIMRVWGDYLELQKNNAER